MKKLLFSLIIVVISFTSGRSQVSDFSASHIPGTKDVQILFHALGDPSALGIPKFSISLDRGLTYVDSVKTFDPSANPEQGTKPGLNRFIWKAGTDLPNIYVDPAFLRMIISVTRDEKAAIQFQNENLPSVLVSKPLPAFEVIQFISGASKAYFASSSEVIIQPGTYVGKSIEDLLSQLDPNFWSPPGREDRTDIVDRPGEPQDGRPIPAEDRDNLKFEGEIIRYPNLPEVESGKPVISTELPRDLKEVTDTLTDQKPAEV